MYIVPCDEFWCKLIGLNAWILFFKIDIKMQAIKHGCLKKLNLSTFGLKNSFRITAIMLNGDVLDGLVIIQQYS